MFRQHRLRQRQKVSDEAGVGETLDTTKNWQKTLSDSLNDKNGDTISEAQHKKKKIAKQTNRKKQ